MMADQKYYDFDAYMEERKGQEKPFVIKAFGEEHEIPNDVPFDLILTVTRAHKDGKEEMSEDQVLEMAVVMFGEENFKKWLKKGIGLKQVMHLTNKVMEMYMANAADTADKSATAKRKGKQTP